MPGWFDIVSLERSALEEGLKGNAPQPEGLRESVDYIHELIRKEVEAGIPEDRIVVGGFSQGGKVALCTMLDHVPALAGCVGLSTWLQPGVSVRSEQTLQRPFFLAHGSADPLLPPFLAQHTYDELHRLGFKEIEFKIYPGMEHSSCYEELKDLEKFLLRSRGVSTVGVYEKSDLVNLALAYVSE
ncbi:hypothetical protein QBZ16_004224 [Prototheca wickerhamii]|uniref:Phospholipase/carboxylesterase/thioesterase domain-containing protein n=1 Tax=Prototheca wickerhamii TaxID=3111 RepID=A0AAD9IHU4_PROWI|nr:hypothetical protein QBZ16_004224 [Prototheca wickerhamii]